MTQKRVHVGILALTVISILTFVFSGLVNPPDSWALPIETDTALTVGFEGNAVRSFARVIRKTNLLQDGNEVSDPEDREVTVYRTPLIIPFRVTPNLVITGIFPILTNMNERTLAGQRVENSSSGIGDLQLLIKHAFYRDDALKKTTRLAWTAGIKLPTGDETTTLPLGSGSVDFIVGGIFTHIVDRFAVHGDLKYKVNTEAHGIRVGNNLKHDLALEYRVIPKKLRSISDKTLNLILEFNGQFVERSKSGGSTVANTGGETLFFSPGLQVVTTPRLIIETLFQYPIVQELYGTQLGVDFTGLVGFRYSF